MNIISNFLERNLKNRVKIHIFGDSMIDQYYSVKVTRISPESPNVCVMLSGDSLPSEEHPGGAANISYQLANFNAETLLFTYVDSEAKEVLSKSGIDNRGLIYLTEGISPKKKRFFHNDTQVGDRWDIEKPNYGQISLEKQKSHLIEVYKAHVNEANVIILSDYDKGFFNNGIPVNLPKNIPIIVDPKKLPLQRWKGCTIFKPNASEAERLSGKSNWKDQCDYFLINLGCEAVVITQEGNGVVGKELKKGFFEYRPKKTIEASKVVGAGDCFVGIFGLAIAHGFSIPEAANIAFEAGAVYVQNPSRSPLKPWQLQKSKLVKPEELANRDFKLVFTNGCFDAGLTKGHVECLRFAKSNGDRLVVALNSDTSIRRLKGSSRPIYHASDRIEIVAGLESVDYVVVFEEDTPLDVIKAIKPDIIVKGGDYEPENVVGFGLAEVIISPFFDSLTTTEKIALVNSN